MLESMVPGGSHPPELGMLLYPRPPSPVFCLTGLSGNVGRPILVGILFGVYIVANSKKYKSRHTYTYIYIYQNNKCIDMYIDINKNNN